MTESTPVAPGAFILPNGQIDLDAQLGRVVADATAVLQVIRPELRIMRSSYRGELDAMRDGWLEHNDDLELTDGGDRKVSDDLFEFLWESAIKSVGQWARDVQVVFDAARLREFIRTALVNAMSDRNGIDMLPEGALDY